MSVIYCSRNDSAQSSEFGCNLGSDVIGSNVVVLPGMLCHAELVASAEDVVA
jgi:hypothetical protein